MTGNKKLEILELLEQGKITAQEAMEMLSQQREIPKDVQDDHYTDEHPSFASPPSSMGWVGDLVNWVGDVVTDVTDGVSDLEITTTIKDLVGGVYGHYKGSETFTSQPITQEIKGLTLLGKNSFVGIRAADIDVIRLRCTFDARRPDVDIIFQEDNGFFGLLYDEKLMRSLSIECEVPRTMINEALIATKNAKIEVEGIKANQLQVSTKNANVKLYGIESTDLVVQNRNANIKAQSITSTNIHLESTNAKISIEDTKANHGDFKTTNARIYTNHIDIAHITICTSNAGLKLDKTLINSGASDGGMSMGSQFPSKTEEERTLRATTTNGGITFYAPSDMGIKLQARTTSGRIKCDLRDMLFSEVGKSHLHGESRDMALHRKVLNVVLQTTNSNVKIT